MYFAAALRFGFGLGSGMVSTAAGEMANILLDDEGDVGLLLLQLRHMAKQRVSRLIA